MRRLILLVLGLLAIGVAPPAAADQTKESYVADRFGRLTVSWSDDTAVTTVPNGGSIEVRAGRPFPGDLESALERTAALLASWAIDSSRTRLELVPASGNSIEAVELDARSVLIAIGPGSLPAIGLRTGQHADFRRAVIEPVDPALTSVERENGRVIASLPGALSATDQGRLAALPGIAAVRVAGGQLVIDLAPGAGLRDLFVEPDKQVIDIYPAGVPGAEQPPVAVDRPAARTATAAEDPAAAAPTAPPAEAPPPPPDASTEASTGTSAEAHPGGAVSRPAEPTPVRHAPPSEWPRFDALAIEAIVRGDGAVELRFGWPELVPAAIFTRGAQLWLAFAAKSGKIAVDTASFSRSAERFVGAIRQEPHPEATILRLSLTGEPTLEVDRNGNAWRVVLGTGPRPFGRDRQATTIEPSHGGILLPQVEQVVSLTDPVVGDRLGVGMARHVGSVTRVPARYVGARFLPAEQGAAWVRLTDGSGKVEPVAGGVRLGPANGVVSGPYDRTAGPATASSAVIEKVAENVAENAIQSVSEIDLASQGHTPIERPASEAATDLAPGEPEHVQKAAQEASHDEAPEATPEMDTAAHDGAPSQARHDTPARGAELATAATGPSPLGLARFRALPHASFWEQKGALETAINGADEAARLPLRHDLVRLHLAHALGTEAAALLDAMRPRVESSGLSPAAARADLALRGAASFLNGRLDEARAALGAASLIEDDETALWHAATLAALERWDEALAQWQRGQHLLESYPAATRALLGQQGIMLLLQAGWIDDAFALIDALRSGRLTAAAADRIDHLEALALARDGATDEAEAIWSRLAREGAPETRSRAIEALTLHDLEAGRIATDEALRRLDADSVHWRGQNDEFRLWQVLASLQRETGQPEAALRTLQAALVREPPVTAATAMTADMAAILDELFGAFGRGERDATTMLQLVRQYSELVAAGTDGDRQILALSEALSALDLPQPAIDLLRDRLRQSTARDADRARLGLALAGALAGAGERQAAVAALLDTTPVEQIEADLSEARRELLSQLGRSADAAPIAGRPTGEPGTPLEAALASARSALERAASEDPAAWREVMEATLGLDALLPARGPLDRQESEIVLIAATAARQLGEVAMVRQLSGRYAERLTADGDAAMLKMLSSTRDLGGAAADVPTDAASYIQNLQQALAAMPPL